MQETLQRIQRMSCPSKQCLAPLSAASTLIHRLFRSLSPGMPQRSISLLFEHVPVEGPLLCFAALILLPKASPQCLHGVECTVRSLSPCCATRRCLEAMHACIQIIQQLLDHAGAQLASRPLMCCYGPHRALPGFPNSRTWGQTAKFTGGATMITRLPTQVNPK